MENKIGYKIELAMKGAGITQKELAETLHTSQSLVSNWITGKIIPGKKNLEKVALVLKKSLGYFLERGEGLSDIPDYSNLTLQYALEECDKEEIEWDLVYKECNQGVTRNSLLMLREVLLKVYREEVIVLDIKTGDNNCGFLIIDKSNFKVYWTGDGFGKGYAGEGPRGHEAATKVLLIYGLCIYGWEDAKIVDTKDKEVFKKMLVDITKSAYKKHTAHFVIPMLCFPSY